MELFFELKKDLKLVEVEKASVLLLTDMEEFFSYSYRSS
jgi:hypothetical protein